MNFVARAALSFSNVSEVHKSTAAREATRKVLHPGMIVHHARAHASLSEASQVGINADHHFGVCRIIADVAVGPFGDIVGQQSCRLLATRRTLLQKVAVEDQVIPIDKYENVRIAILGFVGISMRLPP